MKKFVVAYMDYMNNDLNQQVIEGYTPVHVMLTMLKLKDYDISETSHLVTEEDVKQFAFDCDCMVSAYEIQ